MIAVFAGRSGEDDYIVKAEKANCYLIEDNIMSITR